MEGQEPTTNNQSTPLAGEPTTPKTFDEAYVKELRGEAAGYRKQLRELQDQLTVLKTEQEGRANAELEQQGEFKKLAEKAQQEAAKLKQQLDEQVKALLVERRNGLVMSIAGRLNAYDPADPNFITATQAVDMASDEAAGQIEKIIQAMVESKPYLFKQQSRIPTGEPFNPSGQPGQARETDAERRARLFGGRRRAFDPDEAKRRGGGVVWPTKPE